MNAQACQDLAPLLAARPLGVLDQDELSLLNAHLALCPGCPELGVQLEEALAATTPLSAQAPLGAWKEILARTRQSEPSEEEAGSSVAINLSCSYCHGQLRQPEAAFCAGCLAPHHEDCFEEHGRCSTPGCGAARVVWPERAHSDRWRRRRHRRGRRWLLAAVAAGGLTAAAVVAVRVAPAPIENQPSPLDVLERGADLVQARRYEEALALLEPQDKGSPVLRAASFTLRARALRGQGRYSEALQDHTRAIGLRPEDARGYTERALTYLEWFEQSKDEWQRGRALSETYRAIELSPELAEAWYLRGRASELSEGIEHLNKALELQPDLATAYLERGWRRFLLKQDLPGALEDLDEAQLLRPEWVDAYLVRSEVLERLGDLPAALVDAERAAALPEPELRVWARLGELRAKSGRLTGAVEAYDKALALEPRAELFLERGRLGAALGRHSQALSDYERVLETSPGDRTALFERATLRVELGQLQAALEDCGEILGEDSSDPNVLAFQADAKRLMGDLKGALADLDAAIHLMPGNAGFYTRRASVRYLRGDHVGVVSDAGRAIDRGAAGDYEPWYYSALAHVALGERELALIELRQAIALKPDSAPLYQEEGRILRDMGRNLAGALVALSKAIELDPSDARSFHERALVHVARGKPQAAFDDLTQALDRDTELVAAWRARAQLFTDQGLWGEARRDLERAELISHQSESLMAQLPGARICAHCGADVTAGAAFSSPPLGSWVIRGAYGGFKSRPFGPRPSRGMSLHLDGEIYQLPEEVQQEHQGLFLELEEGDLVAVLLDAEKVVQGLARDSLELRAGACLDTGRTGSRRYACSPEHLFALRVREERGETIKAPTPGYLLLPADLADWEPGRRRFFLDGTFEGSSGAGIRVRRDDWEGGASLDSMVPSGEVVELPVSSKLERQLEQGAGLQEGNESDDASRVRLYGEVALDQHGALSLLVQRLERIKVLDPEAARCASCGVEVVSTTARKYRDPRDGRTYLACNGEHLEELLRKYARTRVASPSEEPLGDPGAAQGGGRR